MPAARGLALDGDRLFVAYDAGGLRVLDISDRANPVEIAHFDSAPYNDNGPGFSATQSGAWSNYPFFGNGLVIFTSVREGLFIMRVRPPREICATPIRQRRARRWSFIRLSRQQAHRLSSSQCPVTQSFFVSAMQ